MSLYLTTSDGSGKINQDNVLTHSLRRYRKPEPTQ